MAKLRPRCPSCRRNGGSRRGTGVTLLPGQNGLHFERGSRGLLRCQLCGHFWLPTRDKLKQAIAADQASACRRETGLGIIEVIKQPEIDDSHNYGPFFLRRGGDR